MMNVGQYREVAVVLENYTDIPGLADHWSRLVSHEGFDVVGEVNGGDKREKTVLLFSTKDLAESDAGKALRRIFSTGEFSVENTRERRSDVVIQLGRDAAIYGKSEL
jgi:hypothetical protein